MDEILGWSTRRFRTAVIYQPYIMSLILLQTSTAGQEHLTLQQPNLYIKEWNLHFYWGLVEMETSVVENPICFFQALDLLSLQEVWLRGQRRQRGDWGWCPCSQWILSLKCLGPPTHCLTHLCFPNTSTYLLLNNKRWMNDWGWLTGCFKLWALLWFRYDEFGISGDDYLGKEPLLTVPKRKGMSHRAGATEGSSSMGQEAEGVRAKGGQKPLLWFLWEEMSEA